MRNKNMASLIDTLTSKQLIQTPSFFKNNKKLLISLLEGAKIGKFYIEEFINRRARNALEFAKTDYAEWEY